MSNRNLINIDEIDIPRNKVLRFKDKWWTPQLNIILTKNDRKTYCYSINVVKILDTLYNFEFLVDLAIKDVVYNSKDKDKVKNKGCLGYKVYEIFGISYNCQNNASIGKHFCKFCSNNMPKLVILQLKFMKSINDYFNEISNIKIPNYLICENCNKINPMCICLRKINCEVCNKRVKTPYYTFLLCLKQLDINLCKDMKKMIFDLSSSKFEYTTKINNTNKINYLLKPSERKSDYYMNYTKVIHRFHDLDIGNKMVKISNINGCLFNLVECLNYKNDELRCERWVHVNLHYHKWSTLSPNSSYMCNGDKCNIVLAKNICVICYHNNFNRYS